MRSPDGSRAGLLWLGLAVALYLALRWLVLASAFDTTALTMYELYPMGTIPRALIEGHSLPLADYYDNAAGQILTGLLAIPFYQELGPSYLALKLVPLALGLFALVLVFLFSRELFGVRAAALAAVLFAVTPVTSVKYSLIASGNHFENVCFSMLAVFAFFVMHRRGCPAGLRFLAGVTAGFAVFVFLGALVPVALLAAVHLGLRGVRRSLKDLVQLVPGFALGVLPLVLLNTGRDSRGMDFVATRFGDEKAAAGAGFGRRLLQFFGKCLPVAGVFPDLGPVPGRVAEWLWLGAFVVAWCAAAGTAWRGARALARNAFAKAEPAPPGAGELARAAFVPLVLFLPLWSIAYGWSDLRIGGYAPPLEIAGFRYFLPHFLFATLLIGAIFARWTDPTRAPRWRVAGWALAIASLASGAFSFAIVDTSFATPNPGASYDGCWYPFFARGLLGRKNQHDQAEVIALAARVPAAHRAQVYFGIGYFKAFEQTRGTGGAEPVFDLASALAGWPERYRQDVARGFGAFFRPDNGDFEDAKGRRALQLADAWVASEEPYAECFVEGMCLPWDYPLVTRSQIFLEENLRMMAFAPERLRAAFSRGTGMFIGRLLARAYPGDVVSVHAILAKTDGTFYPQMCAGIGYALSDGREEPRLHPLIDKLDAERHRPLAWRGFAAGLKHLYESEELAAVVAPIAPTLPKPVLEQLAAH